MLYFTQISKKSKVISGKFERKKEEILMKNRFHQDPMFLNVSLFRQKEQGPQGVVALKPRGKENVLFTLD